MMIYIALIVGVLIVVMLYSCIATSTAYDKKISDQEQEVFLKNNNNKIRKSGE